MAGRKIELYFSSRRHAGENLDDVLERRSPSSPIPITTPHRKDTGFYNIWPFTNGLAPVMFEPNRQYTPPQGSVTEDVGHKWAYIDNANSAIRLSGYADGN